MAYTIDGTEARPWFLAKLKAYIQTALLNQAPTSVAAATGTATRTTFATGSVTTEQLAERVMALLADLKTAGVIK